MERVKQKQMVADYMREHGSITDIEAFLDLGVRRLAARIANLKADGYVISSTRKAVVNRYGGTVYIAEYRFVEDKA